MHSDRKHVLVVDDSRTLAGVLRLSLERERLLVTVAHDGCAALECAGRHQFDAVITDYQMPRMDGHELCRRLRATAGYAETPLVMITSKGLELELSRLEKELGFAASFVKPFSPRQVVQTIKECLRAERPLGPTAEVDAVAAQMFPANTVRPELGLIS